MESADFTKWTRDEAELAEIGRHLSPQKPRVTVRLPADVARVAVAAWERDDLAPLPTTETPDEARVRLRAAALALIGLAISESGVWTGDEVTVDLDAASVGASLDAADERGLLSGPLPFVE